jgi:hypothetical protein
MIGRYTTINNQPEVSTLTAGLDFRQPQYRREVFLNFYGFHLKYKAHPGAVYYTMPYISWALNYTQEQKLWMAFINGCSQNIVTTKTILDEFPDVTAYNHKDFNKWFREHYQKLGWDTDRRYVKNKLEEVIEHYIAQLGERTQYEYFEQAMGTQDPHTNFENLWQNVMTNFHTFGRLATFSYLEYLRIVGLNLDCNSLFLDDIDGSKSHRNGLCKVLGRDDLDWHQKTNPNFTGYTPQQIEWLKTEGELLLNDAKEKFKDEPFYNDISYFTLESTLCCYKSWHRPNRRYPNVYNDMFYGRIVNAEKKWAGQKDFSIFWDARKKYLPAKLRLEDNWQDCGLKPEKQNHYLHTGQVIMMDDEYPHFVNQFNQKYYGN